MRQLYQYLPCQFFADSNSAFLNLYDQILSHRAYDTDLSANIKAQIHKMQKGIKAEEGEGVVFQPDILMDGDSAFLPVFTNEEQVIQVVTTVRTDPRQGLISKESPFGKAVLGAKEGDRVTVRVSDDYSYVCEIRHIEKGADDGSAPILQY